MFDKLDNNTKTINITHALFTSYRKKFKNEKLNSWYTTSRVAEAVSVSNLSLETNY